MGKQISELQRHSGELENAIALERASQRAFVELRERMTATPADDLSPTRPAPRAVDEDRDRGRER